MNPNLKYKKKFFWGGEGGVGVARVSDFLQRIHTFFDGGDVGRGEWEWGEG